MRDDRRLPLQQHDRPERRRGLGGRRGPRVGVGLGPGAAPRPSASRRRACSRSCGVTMSGADAPGHEVERTGVDHDGHLARQDAAKRIAFHSPRSGCGIRSRSDEPRLHAPVVRHRLGAPLQHAIARGPEVADHADAGAPRRLDAEDRGARVRGPIRFGCRALLGNTCRRRPLASGGSRRRRRPSTIRPWRHPSRHPHPRSARMTAPLLALSRSAASRRAIACGSRRCASTAPSTASRRSGTTRTSRSSRRAVRAS